MIWLTEIRAVDPVDGQMKTWAGPDVPGNSREEAERYCQENGLGYCEVIGSLVLEWEEDRVVAHATELLIMIIHLN